MPDTNDGQPMRSQPENRDKKTSNRSKYRLEIPLGPHCQVNAEWIGKYCANLRTIVKRQPEKIHEIGKIRKFEQTRGQPSFERPYGRLSKA